MFIISLDKLNAFSKKHADARKSISTWLSTTEIALWKKKQEVLDDFPKAKMIKNNRARFQIDHNTYRLLAFANYDAETVVVRFIGTNAEIQKTTELTPKQFSNSYATVAYYTNRKGIRGSEKPL
jgi:mRNA interferase HigB